MSDPGYKFDDEKNDLRHEGKVTFLWQLWANTNGSQFFITVVATPWLDGGPHYFRKVISGLETIDAIATVEKGHKDKPREDGYQKSRNLH